MIQRDILNVQFAEGVRVRVLSPSWIEQREGRLTGISHRAGTLQVLRYVVRFPHSRTKCRYVDISIEASNLEIIQL